MPSIGPSAKLRVLEASAGIAGAYCGWLLRQTGAQVRRIALGPADTGQDPLSLARRYVGDSKPVVALDDQTWGEAEIVNPRLIMVAMSGAGQFGPLSDMRTYAPARSSFAGLEGLVGYEGEAPDEAWARNVS